MFEVEGGLRSMNDYADNAGTSEVGASGPGGGSKGDGADGVVVRTSLGLLTAEFAIVPRARNR